MENVLTEAAIKKSDQIYADAVQTIPAEDMDWLTDSTAGAAMYSRALTWNAKEQKWERI